jgi:hypothetical protein
MIVSACTFHIQVGWIIQKLLLLKITNRVVSNIHVNLVGGWVGKVREQAAELITQIELSSDSALQHRHWHNPYCVGVEGYRRNSQLSHFVCGG